MQANVLASVGVATKGIPASGSDSSPTPGSGSDSDDWFYEAAQSLLGKDAGLHLHYITGYPQSSCYAYVAHNAAQRRRPPDHFLRKLFHSEQGGPFHDAFMHGCAAGWWIAQQRARVMASILIELRERIDALR